MNLLERIRGPKTDETDENRGPIPMPATAEEKLKAAPNASDWGARKNMYEAAARQLMEEGKGFFEPSQEARKAQLRAFELRGIVTVKVIADQATACANCKANDGIQMPLPEALQKMIVPVKDCTFQHQGSQGKGWCRCLYVPVIESKVPEKDKIDPAAIAPGTEKPTFI